VHSQILGYILLRIIIKQNPKLNSLQPQELMNDFYSSSGRHQQNKTSTFNLKSRNFPRNFKI